MYSYFGDTTLGKRGPRQFLSGGGGPLAAALTQGSPKLEAIRGDGARVGEAVPATTPGWLIPLVPRSWQELHLFKPRLQERLIRTASRSAHDMLPIAIVGGRNLGDEPDEAGETPALV